MSMGQVYFIQMGEDGPIKIGFTHNIVNRMIALRTASPYKLNLLYIADGDTEAETNLHGVYRHHRLEGEWFSNADEIKRDIEAFKVLGFPVSAEPPPPGNGKTLRIVRWDTETGEIVSEVSIPAGRWPFVVEDKETGHITFDSREVAS